MPDKIDRKEEGAALCAAYEVEDLKVAFFSYMIFLRCVFLTCSADSCNGFVPVLNPHPHPVCISNLADSLTENVLVSCFRFWVFYRAKQDGPVVLVSFRFPFSSFCYCPNVM